VKKARFDLPGALLLVTAAAVWLARGGAAGVACAQALGVSRSAAELFLAGLALVLALAGVVRLREVLGAIVASIGRALDAVEAKLEKWPRGAAVVMRAVVVTIVAGTTTALVLDATRFGESLESRAIDLFFRLRFPTRSQVELATASAERSANPQPDVVVLALDDETITRLGWPVPRMHYARLIDAAAAAKPASLTFDLSLVDPAREHPEWDLAIGDAARRAGNVGFTFAIARASGDVTPPLSTPALKALDANALPWHESAAALPDYAELIGGRAVVSPVIDPVAESAHLIAMANVLLDGDDDVLRHSLLVARLGQRLLPSLSLRLAAGALGVPLEAVRVFPGSHIDVGGKTRIPIDELGRALVRYQGRHDAHGAGPFRYVSIWSLLRTDASVTLVGNPLGDDQRFVIDDTVKVTRDGATLSLAEAEAALFAPGARVSGKARYDTDPGRVLELSIAEAGEPDFELLDETTLRFGTTFGAVKRARVDLGELAGKHLLVGSTALAAADLRNGPLGELPGVEHHATMLANILHGDVFTPLPPWLHLALLFTAALLAALAGAALSSELGLLAGGGLVLTWLTASFLAFSSGRVVPIVAPPVAMVVASLACVVLGARASRAAKARAEQEREFVRSTFGRYLTEQVVDQLLGSPDGLRLGGKRAFVTIMMTDLRGFTSMCGSMEPEGVVKLLNHYLEAMTRIIARYGGTIDEFIGDAILVVFGAPVPLEHTETRAVACAIEMLNAMPEINRWNVEQKLPTVEMGIGIHSGEVVLGNIGSELRAKYGIVGSTINLTSRVESYTVGGQVLISEATRSRCLPTLQVGLSQEVSPKGVKGTLTIHEALGVGAPFDVTLAGAAESLVKPGSPLEVRYAHVQGKEVGELAHRARVEALSDQGFELAVDEALAPLTNLLLRVVDGEGLRAGDLYAKVLKSEVRPGVVYARLTSVPPELKSFLEGAASRPAEVVPESALVSA
jgi:adenylate cyclase